MIEIPGQVPGAWVRVTDSPPYFFKYVPSDIAQVSNKDEGDKKTTPHLNPAWMRIRTNVTDFMEDPFKRFLHLNNPPGDGKSSNTLKALRDYRFIYLAETHKVAEEQQEKHPEIRDLERLESRDRVCDNQIAKQLAKYGVNIKWVCENCYHREFCDYYERMRVIMIEPQSWVGVHSHLGNLAQMYCDTYDVDVVLMDECCANSMCRDSGKIYKGNILSNIASLVEMQKKSAEQRLVSSILQEMRDAINSSQLSPIGVMDSIKRYFNSRERTGKDNLIAFSERYERYLIDRYNVDGKVPRHNLITPIVNAAINVWEQRSDPEYPEKVFQVFPRRDLGEDEIPNRKKGIKGRNRHVNITWYDLNALQLPNHEDGTPTKVIFLDGTTSPTMIEKLCQEPVETTFNPSGSVFPPSTTITQVTSGKYVMKTLWKSGEPTAAFNKLLDITRMIVQKHQSKVLVAARKKFKEKIQEINPDLVITEHYPCKGTCNYEDVNVCVVFGTPELSHETKARRAALLHCTEEEALRIEREDNMLQFIHRLRSRLKPDTLTFIYILSSVDLGIDNVHKVTLKELMRELRKETSSRDFVRASILRLTKGAELTRADLNKQVGKDNNMVWGVINELVESGKVIKVNHLNHNGAGHPTVYFTAL